MEPHPLPDDDLAQDSNPPLELLPSPVGEDEPEPDDEDEEQDEEAAPAPRADHRCRARGHDDPLKLYVRAIGDGRLLTPVEERELARRKDLGDEAASGS
jgi:hypothetical protein